MAAFSTTLPLLFHRRFEVRNAMVTTDKSTYSIGDLITWNTSPLTIGQTYTLAFKVGAPISPPYPSANVIKQWKATKATETGTMPASSIGRCYLALAETISGIERADGAINFYVGPAPVIITPVVPTTQLVSPAIFDPSIILALKPGQLSIPDDYNLVLSGTTAALKAVDAKYKVSVFNQLLLRLKSKVYPSSSWSNTDPSYFRTFLESDFNEPVKYYGKCKNGWYSAVARADDCQTADEVDSDCDIVIGFYYDTVNVDNIPGWPANNPIMAMDTYFAGLYNKQLYLDAQLLRTYRPDPNTWNAGATLWIKGDVDTNGEGNFQTTTTTTAPGV